MLKLPVVDAETPVSAALSLLVKVSVLAALVVPAFVFGNVADAGVKVASAVPVPVTATDCGLLGALSEKVIEPVRAPSCVGVKETVTRHLPPGTSWPVQVLVWTAKSPLGATPENFRFALPVLVTVMLLVLEVWPADSFPNASDAGEKDARGAGETVSWTPPW